MQRRNFFLQFLFISFLQSATPFPAPRGVAEERPLERAAQSRTPGLIEDFQNLGNNIFGLFSQGLGRPRRPNPFNQFNQNQIQSKPPPRFPAPSPSRFPVQPPSRVPVQPPPSRVPVQSSSFPQAIHEISAPAQKPFPVSTPVQNLIPVQTSFVQDPGFHVPTAVQQFGAPAFIDAHETFTSRSKPTHLDLDLYT
ncbi:uncharacterized protein LOC111706487 [Eurytemora carolleeae]|uniref:uncharacterized protein LOC111706487 n=1 Tax=Eurytemora carolleeae TaxID=1294199 RepID=UPI000C7794B9|nr:uncharacterized protein LOC111706487 [Eurytemora carolleeae]|eukprot:XP_023335140.1 uncharacterized protein LOC111706487 [Eurytemora affinis]